MKLSKDEVDKLQGVLGIIPLTRTDKLLNDLIKEVKEIKEILESWKK
jgi:hypothetical protein